MKRILHGWISLLLMAIIVALGFKGILKYSCVFTGIYGCVVFAGMTAVLAAFCSKCPCRLTSCRHIILGPITRILPRRVEGKYSTVDLVFTAAGFLSIIIYPQFWLFRDVPIFIGYWATVILLVLEITLFICTGCENEFCPMRKYQMKVRGRTIT
jgi:hypothetical protein